MDILPEAYEPLSCTQKSRLRLNSSFSLQKFMQVREFEFSIDKDSVDEMEDLEDDEESGQDSTMTLNDNGKAGNSVFKTYFDSNFEESLDLKSDAFENFLWQTFREKDANADGIDQSMTSIYPNDLVMKQIFKSGDGQPISEECVVLAHYVLFVQNGDELFDTSVMRKVPAVFDLRKADSLPGLDLALRSMRVGEVSKFIIQPVLAYGVNGMPPRVPKNSVISCYLEMLAIVDERILKLPLLLTAAERAELPFTVVAEAAKQLHVEANEKYKGGNAKDALKRYRKAAFILEDYPVLQKSDAELQGSLLSKLYNNIAQCYLALENPKQACIACKLGLKASKGTENVKMLTRYAKAKYILEDFDKAVELCNQALKVEPNNAYIKSIKHEAETMLKRNNQGEYNMFKGIFKK